MEKKNEILMLILCLIIGIVLTIQLKSVSNSTGGIVSSLKAKQLSSELSNLKDRKEELLKELQRLDTRIEDYKLSDSKEYDIVNNLKKDINKYNVLSGYTVVKGSGIELSIFVDENIDPSIEGYSDSREKIIYNYEYILYIINKLYASGAEAVCVNDERIIFSSEIHLTQEANTTKMLINNKPIEIPIKIKAIGNPKTLDAALNMRFGILDHMKEYLGIESKVEQRDEIEIPRYNEKIEFKYAKPIE